jgi:hypothetical protein
MSQMEHKAKFLQCGGLEEFAIPLFDEVKWWMPVGGNDAMLTKLWMGKAMDTSIVSWFNIAESAGWWSGALVFQENRQICIPMRQPFLQEVIASLSTMHVRIVGVWCWMVKSYLAWFAFGGEWLLFR